MSLAIILIETSEIDAFLSQLYSETTTLGYLVTDKADIVPTVIDEFFEGFLGHLLEMDHAQWPTS
jgi:hypothetical protein